MPAEGSTWCLIKPQCNAYLGYTVPNSNLATYSLGMGKKQGHGDRQAYRGKITLQGYLGSVSLTLKSSISTDVQHTIAETVMERTKKELYY